MQMHVRRGACTARSERLGLPPTHPTTHTVHEAVQHPQHAAVFGAVALAMSTLGAAGVTLSKALWEAMHPPGYFAKDKVGARWVESARIGHDDHKQTFHLFTQESTILYGVEIPEASLLHQPALQRCVARVVLPRANTHRIAQGHPICCARTPGAATQKWPLVRRPLHRNRVNCRKVAFTQGERPKVCLPV